MAIMVFRISYIIIFPSSLVFGSHAIFLYRVLTHREDEIWLDLHLFDVLFRCYLECSVVFFSSVKGEELDFQENLDLTRTYRLDVTQNYRLKLAWGMYSNFKCVDFLNIFTRFASHLSALVDITSERIYSLKNTHINIF